MHINLTGTLSLGWADRLINNDLLHKGANHFVRQFRAVPILVRKGKVLVGLCRSSLHIIQPDLIFGQFIFQQSVFLLVLFSQFIESFLGDMPQSIVLVQLLQQMFQTSDVFLLFTDLLCSCFRSSG